MKKENIHIGCSAFNNTYWKEIFYPEDMPRSKWFDFYATKFNTYELNGTFYKAPTVNSLNAWYDKVPAGFLFSVKAPKLITHFKKFSNCENEIAEFYKVCREGLKEKLACILFQLPPSFDYNPERLDLILKALHPDFKNTVEFRHESWWNKIVFDAFKTHQITFCSVSFNLLPKDLIATNSVGYIRLHGVPKLFYSDYGHEKLLGLQKEIQAQHGWKEVFVYFNNTASTSGILNALDMKALNDKF